MSDEVNAGIEDMLKSLSNKPMPDTEEEEQEETNTEENTEEGIEEPSEESESEGDEGEGDEGEEEESNESPSDEKDDLINELKQKLDALEAKVNKKEEPPPEEFKVEAQDFIGEEDIYETINDKEGLNRLLNTVYEKGIMEARDSVFKSLPDIVSGQVRLVLELKETRDNFYKDNPELIGHEEVVKETFGKLASESPDKTYKQILSSVGKEVRTKLGIKKGKVKDTDLPPRLPGKRGRQRTNINTDSESHPSEIEEMNKVLGR